MGSAPRAADLLPRCCPRAGSERPKSSARRGGKKSRVGRILWTVDCARPLPEPRQTSAKLSLGELKGGGVRASSSTCACEAGVASQSRVSTHEGPGLSVLACELRCAWSWNQPPSATCELAGAGRHNQCFRHIHLHGSCKDSPDARKMPRFLPAAGSDFTAARQPSRAPLRPSRPFRTSASQT